MLGFVVQQQPWQPGGAGLVVTENSRDYNISTGVTLHGAIQGALGRILTHCCSRLNPSNYYYKVVGAELPIFWQLHANKRGLL